MARFPRNSSGRAFGWPEHNALRGRDGMMTARTAVAMMAGTVALYLHSQHAPWPAPGTVPILDPVELRNSCSYLLCRVW